MNDLRDGSELWRRSATELARLIAAKEVSSVEVVEAHLARIDDVNPRLNAIVRRLDVDARAAALAADRAQRDGRPLGRLHGVPFTVKENIDLRGSPTTHGLAALAGAIAPSDAPVVERFKAAGAIPIGRTNMPSFAFRVTTDSVLHGITSNPWCPTVTAGGSSGGEAAALASGMSPIGLGNDLGGSLRSPAHCCGITSLKPSAGLVPWASSMPPFDPPLAIQLMMSEGPMARSVADLGVALDILAGPHDRDPRSLQVAFGERLPSRPLRVGVMAEPPGGSTHPAIAGAIRRIVDELATAGAEVSDLVPPAYERVIDIWTGLVLADMRLVAPTVGPLMGENGAAFLEACLDIDRERDLVELAGLQRERSALQREWHACLGRVDVLVCPTWTQPPFREGADIVDVQAVADTLELIRPVLPANALGLPAAVVPIGTAGGLPIGAQLIGRRFSDHRVLAAAQRIEALRGPLTPIDPH